MTRSIPETMGAQRRRWYQCLPQAVPIVWFAISFWSGCQTHQTPPVPVHVVTDSPKGMPASTSAENRRQATLHQPVDSLDSLLETIRVKQGLPALGAAVVRGNRLIALGAVGVRKAGSPELVQITDRWHIGSCTKSMTAVLAAQIVEAGMWRWKSTLPEILPDLAEVMKPEWKRATVEQLLAHLGGAPQSLDIEGLHWRIAERRHLSPFEQRSYLTKELLTKTLPLSEPGTQYLYSNAGFAIVGHALENKLGMPWEEILLSKLAHPLGMTSVGFGTPCPEGTVEQPWGHHRGSDGELIPVAPGPNGDNTPAIGPAGTVHASLEDLAKYVAFHLTAGSQTSPILKPEGVRRLHTEMSPGHFYSAGWTLVKRPWAGGEAWTHDGSNLSFYTTLWIAPNRNLAFVVCTNYGGENAFPSVDQAVWALIQQYLNEKPPS